jgi:nucleoside-diphosphate-sugar epimerase
VSRRVLLTGATGFVGRHAGAALARRGFEVHAVARAPGPAAEGVAWHAADLLDGDAARRLVDRIRPTHLLHLAWYVEHGKFWHSPENLRWVAASLELVRAFRQAGGERAVLSGTCAEYEWGHGLCSEASTPTVPATLYGACKLALHQVVEAYARQSGMSAAWGRIFLLYGPHEPPARLVASVARALLRGEPAPCSHGMQVRDFLHAADAADAFAALLDSDVRGAVNIGSGEPVALRDVVQALAARAGRPDLLRLGALPAAPGDPAALTADVSRLRGEVGWSPALSLEAGLDDVVRWWRNDAHAPAGAR